MISRRAGGLWYDVSPRPAEPRRCQIRESHCHAADSSREIGFLAYGTRAALSGSRSGVISRSCLVSLVSDQLAGIINARTRSLGVVQPYTRCATGRPPHGPRAVL